MTRDKAREFIESLLILRNAATDEQATEASAVYPEWKINENYTIGQRVLYKEILYKVLQDHTSQETWTPIDAPSLFAKVLIPNDNVISIWEQPDSTNTYMKDDKVIHNDKIWKSLINNNVWEPGTIGTESLWIEIAE